MFGIGFSELIVIGIILIVAVGPNRMPGMLKAVVKAYREFRRATRELRASTGIDEILQDEELRSLRKPLHVPPAPSAKPAPKRTLSYEERLRERPREGVDIAHIREEERKPSPEEAARIRASKEASLAPSAGADDAERVRAAKIAAAREQGTYDDPRDDDEYEYDDEYDDPEAERIRAAKIAAAQRAVPDEGGERIRAAKIAAAQRAREAGEEPA
jgi:Tat protein translocase TatB subunit